MGDELEITLKEYIDAAKRVTTEKTSIARQEA